MNRSIDRTSKGEISMTTKAFQGKIPFARRAMVYFALATAVTWPVVGQTTTNQRPPLMDRQREIVLALSACPPSVASKAAVYVLDHAGYVKVRDTQNGFTAIVQHAVPASQDPQCMDAEGTRTFLPRYLKVAEWRAGKSADQIKLLVADAFAKAIFQAPTKPGIDYMLSTENLTPNAGEVVHFPPHVMFYAPYLTNAELGSASPLGPDGNPAGPAFVAAEGTPYALIIIPVAAHSNGQSH
jgi:hypothetical protein